MPLVHLHVPAGLDADRVTGLAEAVHAALVATSDVPARDRFQYVHRHASGDRFVDPTFPQALRSGEAALVSITFRRGRSEAQKRALYRAIADGAAERAGLRGDDVMIVLAENTAIDWSFGGGVATYAPA